MKKHFLLLAVLLLSAGLFAKDLSIQFFTGYSKSEDPIRKIEIANATRYTALSGKVDNGENFALGFSLKGPGDKSTFSLGDMESKWKQNCNLVLFDVPDNKDFELRIHKDGSTLYLAIVEK